MSETYCGKSCAECARKEAMNCPGCKAGPGRPFGGDCELAGCARGKGHESCGSCGFRGNCGTLRGRDSMPDQRKRKQEAEETRKAAIARRAPILGKWLWLLFWIIVPSTIGSILSNDTVAAYLPGLSLPGQILNGVCSLAYGLILLKAASEEDRYRTAGICVLIAGGVITLVAILSGGNAPTWTLLVTIPAAIAALMGEYNEYMGHSAVLAGVDNELAEKWKLLWKWYIGFFFGLFGCLLLLVIIPALGLLGLLAAAVGVLVVSVLKLIYLYRTAKCFREYS